MNNKRFGDLSGRNLQHPIISNMERTGYSSGRAPTYPCCPVCGEECEVIYKNNDRDIVGCDICVVTVDAWEVTGCFPEKE